MAQISSEVATAARLEEFVGRIDTGAAGAVYPFGQPRQ